MSSDYPTLFGNWCEARGWPGLRVSAVIAGAQYDACYTPADGLYLEINGRRFGSPESAVSLLDALGSAGALFPCRSIVEQPTC
jgi:hypothetical protein